MNSGKIGADGTGGRDGTGIEGSIRGPRGPKKEDKILNLLSIRHAHDCGGCFGQI